MDHDLDANASKDVLDGIEGAFATIAYGAYDDVKYRALVRAVWALVDATPDSAPGASR